MEYEFKLGQPVYDSFRYKGIVGIVESIGSDWVRVSYPTNQLSRMAVYRNRKYMETDAFPTLCPFPYEFEVKEVQQFQKGDLVLWRNNEGHRWNIAKHWGEMKHGQHLVQAFGEFETHAKFVIPFEKNESKLWKIN